MNQLELEAILRSGESDVTTNPYNKSRIKRTAERIALIAAATASAITVSGITAACGNSKPSSSPTKGSTSTLTTSSLPKSSVSTLSASELGSNKEGIDVRAYTISYFNRIWHGREPDVGVFNGKVVLDGAKAKLFNYLDPELREVNDTMSNPYYKKEYAGMYAILERPVVFFTPGMTWIGVNEQTNYSFTPTGEIDNLFDQATDIRNFTYIPVENDAAQFYVDTRTPDGGKPVPFLPVAVQYMSPQQASDNLGLVAQLKSENKFNNFYIPSPIPFWQEITPFDIAAYTTTNKVDYTTEVIGGFTPKTGEKFMIAGQIDTSYYKPYDWPSADQIKHLIETAPISTE